VLRLKAAGLLDVDAGAQFGPFFGGRGVGAHRHRAVVDGHGDVRVGHDDLVPVGVVLVTALRRDHDDAIAIVHRASQHVGVGLARFAADGVQLDGHHAQDAAWIPTAGQCK
jgi:hypothetical protein